MKDKLIVSPAPHFHDRTNIPNVMWNVVLALLPAQVFAVINWGFWPLALTMIGVIAAVLTEAAIQKFRKIPITVSDGSAVLTGVLLTFNISPGAPWWLPIMGSVFAIAVGKQVFGGLGNNPVNPALLGRAFLLASWPALMTGTKCWVQTAKGVAMSGVDTNLIAANLAKESKPLYDLVSGATPLNVAHALRDSNIVATFAPTKEAALDLANKTYNGLIDLSTLKALFWGNVGGCIGEVSAFALLLGAAWLLWKNIIEWRIPFFYLATVFVLSFLFGPIQGAGFSLALPFFHLFAGGLMLGAFFMATDYTTSPLTKNGRIIYAVGCGVLTVVIRLWGGYPEGVSYSILFMNVMTPLIDKMTMPKPFGRAKK